MAISAPIQGHFDGGEISPLLYGRVDSDRYKGALARCKNWMPTLQGGLPRRPGTYYLGAVKTAADKTRLIPFQYSTTQAYMLEFGNGYIRFWSNRAQVTSGGLPYEISTPYGLSDLASLRFTQSADVLYIVHPAYQPRKLVRYAATDWSLNTIVFQDGPYLPVVNVDARTQTASIGATTGSSSLNFGSVIGVHGAANNGSGLIRLLVDSTTGFETGQHVVIAAVGGTVEANGSWRITVIDATHIDLVGSAFVHAYTAGGAVTIPIFESTDVGRLIRLEASSKWGWGIITAYSSSTSVTVSVQATLGGTTIASYALGVWSATTGYPGTVGFHEDRLCFAKARSYPQRIDGSVTADYENFAPTATDGTVANDNALDFSANANDVNTLNWLTSDEKGLLTGATSAEWVMRPSNSNEALTPTNVVMKRASKWGSADLAAIQAGKATVFVQRGSRKLREMSYFFDIDGYRATDLTELAEHITGDGVVDLVYQNLPMPIIWALRSDGILLGATYDRDGFQLRVGWHWHELGGQSDAGGTAPIIESIAVIPSPDGTHDDLWMIVQRYVNGASVRYVEYLTKIFEDVDDQNDAFFSDCGLTYDSPLTIEGISSASPGVVHITAHGLSTGDTVRVSDVVGVVDSSGASVVNDLRTTVTVINANHFSLDNTDTSTATAYVSGGKVRKMVSTITGLTHLIGETVQIWADGASRVSQVVDGSGHITLQVKAGTVSVGYAYDSDGQQLRLEAGSRNGTSIGKTRRIHRMGVMVHRAGGLQIGQDFDNLDSILFRTQGVDDNGRASPLQSGLFSFPVSFGYDFENQLCFRASGPAPCTLLALMPQMETQDRG